MTTWVRGSYLARATAVTVMIAIMSAVLPFMEQRPSQATGRNWDFETGTLAGWTVNGPAELNAFDSQPTYGPNSRARRPDQPPNHQGTYWLGTYEDRRSANEQEGRVQGDGPTGSLVSEAFTIDAPAMSFLVGGGSNSQLVYVGLIVDGELRLRTSGENVETMRRHVWDLRQLQGRRAQIVVVDNSSDAWGHINADDFRYEQGVPADATPPATPRSATATPVASATASPAAPATRGPRPPVPTSVPPAVRLVESCPTWDFETGDLQGWTDLTPQAGSGAFARQPTYGNNVEAERALRASRMHMPRLGGNYWRVPFPIGTNGSYWLGTAEDRATPQRPWGSTRGDNPTGLLRSPVFTLARRYVTFLMGGRGAGQQVQLWVGPRSGTSDFVLELTETLITNDERVSPVVWDVSRFQGRQAFFLVEDGTAEIEGTVVGGHVNLDDFRCADQRPEPAPQPVFGFGDYHTHPLAYLGFGGLRGIHTMAGTIGGRASDYSGERGLRLLARDLAPCDGGGHGGGPLAPLLINGMEGRLPEGYGAGAAFFDILFNPGGLVHVGRQSLSHPRSGAPLFPGWPTYKTGAHQQMHITQIYRAYQGGLRLMVASPNHNRLLEFMMGEVEGPGTLQDGRRYVTTTPDREILDAFVCTMRRVEKLNSDWLGIAYSPEQARQIVAGGRLAIVLGSELPQLGTLGFNSAAEEARYLHSLGLRLVTPIHGYDNAIGGAAVFQDVYNTTGDLVNRPRRLAHMTAPQYRDLHYTGRHLFETREGGCGVARGRQGERGECVGYRLGSTTNIAVLDYNIFTGDHPGAVEMATGRRYAGRGHLNRKGLTDYGRQYLRELMGLGMIIDIDHMSDLSTQQAFDEAVIAGVPGPARGSCPLGDLHRLVAAPAVCLEKAYPLVSSHESYRAQSVQVLADEPSAIATTVKDWTAREFERTDTQLEAFRRIGGVVGPPTGSDPVDCGDRGQYCPGSVANDCAGSSKGGALNYLYAHRAMGSRGVGLSTDFAFHPLTSPRFGPDACDAIRAADVSVRPVERVARASQFNGAAQRDRVAYTSDGSHPPLRPAVLGTRQFDYNTEGLAHYGLLPDYLQDLRNVGMQPEELEALFLSAEDMIRSWEKGWSVANCSQRGRACSGGRLPAALPCEQVCRGDRCGFVTADVYRLGLAGSQRPDPPAPIAIAALVTAVLAGTALLVMRRLARRAWASAAGASRADTPAGPDPPEDDDTPG